MIRELLRTKGIGPKGSKSLSSNQLEQLDQLINQKQYSDVTMATLLTAFLLLEPTPDEKKWLESLKKSYRELIPPHLCFLFENADHPLEKIILDLIQLKDLDAETSRIACSFLFSKEVPDYLKASFLEAERLKRESKTENQTFYEVFQEHSSRKSIELPYVVHLCDSFDGTKRINQYTVFTACVLAAMDIPTCIPGIDEVAPKLGMTPQQVLASSGKKTTHTLEEAATTLMSNGWCYVDQSEFLPALYDLKQMRFDMVKRPFLATFEKILLPVYSTYENYVVTAYTHAHYRQEMLNVFKRNPHITKGINMKGTEATTIPAINKPTDMMILTQNEGIIEDNFTPVVNGKFDKDQNISCSNTLREGLSALKGDQNYASASILNQALLVTTKLLNYDSEKAENSIKYVMSSGKALEKWEKYGS